MDGESPVAGVAQGGSHSFVVKLTNGRSFELSFEQLLAHTMYMQAKRGRLGPSNLQDESR